MWKLVFANIMQRRTRAVVSLAAVSLGVLLTLLSVGLAYGQLNDQAGRARRVGGDFILQPAGASLFFSLNSGTMDAELGRVAEQIPGVAGVTPVLVKFISDGFFSLFGVDPPSFQKVSGGVPIIEGRMIESGLEVIVDTIYAPIHDLKPGSTMALLSQEFTVVGVYEAGMATRVMVPLSTLQELNQTPGKTTLFFVRTHEGVSLDEAEAKILETFEGYQLTRTEGLKALLADSAPGFKQFLWAMISISISISFMVTLLTMYSTIVERTRDIGILKSLGASKAFIVQLILRESFVICGIGVGIGFAATAIGTRLLHSSYPSVPVDIEPFWRLFAVLIAIVGGLLGAVYPAIRAARLDPVTALGYE